MSRAKVLCSEGKPPTDPLLPIDFHCWNPRAFCHPRTAARPVCNRALQDCPKKATTSKPILQEMLIRTLLFYGKILPVNCVQPSLLKSTGQRAILTSSSTTPSLQSSIDLNSSFSGEAFRLMLRCMLVSVIRWISRTVISAKLHSTLHISASNFLGLKS